MTEPIVSDPVVDPNAEPNPSEKKEEGVFLSQEDYKRLINQVSQMEAKMAQLQEPKYASPPEPEPELNEDEFAKMSPKTFYESIVSNVGEKIGKPLFEAITAVNVKLEIMQTRGKYGEDFDANYADVQKTAIANPMMSVEDAYLLVKSKKGASIPNKIKEEPLKPKELPKPPISERPGPSSLKAGEKLSAREAATKAFEELNKQGG
jgi:hypothetical protein